MKPVLLLVTFIFLSLQLLVAQTASHSPEKALADSIFKAGTQKMNTGLYAEAIVLFEKTLPLFQKLNLSNEMGISLHQIATAHYYQSNYAKALDFFNQSRGYYHKASNAYGEAVMLNNMGAVYYYLGNKLKALDLYKQSMAVQKKGGDKKIFAATTQNIGGIYVSIKDYKNGMAYFQQAYQLQLELKDSVSLSQSLNGIGEIYAKQQNYSEAFTCLNQSLAIANKLHNKLKQSEVLYSLGELFNKQKKYREALSYYHLCSEIAQHINNPQYLSNSKIGTGDVLNKMGNPSAAVQSCGEGFRLAEQLGSITLKSEACDCLYQSYKSLGNTPLALRFFEKYTSYKDSLQSQEIASQAQNMEFQKQQLADSVAHARKEYLVQQTHKEEVRKKEQQRNYIIGSLGFLAVIAVGLWSRLNFVRKSREAIQKEKDISENLLLNILPKDIADELKAKGSVEAQHFNAVSILFSDFKSFTQTAEKMSPQRLVEELNACFKAFDRIMETYQIEKIKTIGDAYMAAGGLPNADQQAARNTVSAALEMQDFILHRARENQTLGKPFFEMRIGIHSGPVVAGIVGIKKFQYDVWGDTVNTASRMESNGEPGRVNVSETIYTLLREDPGLVFEHRGAVHAKGKGDIHMYFVTKNDRFV